MTDRSAPVTRFSQLFGLLCALTLLPLLAGAEEPRRFDIPPQSLGLALIAYSKQADRLVVAPQDLVAGKTAPAVAGDMPAQEALIRLLAGSGLHFEQSADGSIRITAGTPSGHHGEPAAADERHQLNLVRIDEAESRAANKTGNKQETAAAEESGDAHGAKGIPEILVRGSRTSNTDIQRTEDDVQPYVVFDSRQIERSLASSVEEFLRTRLPMNSSDHTNAQSTNGAFQGNESTIDLRGLGANQTLILVNGRRQPAVSNIASSGAFVQPDLNGIPMAAIERIEILPSTASGIYGGGATGGVVNVILKRNYSGYDLKVGYDNTFTSDAAQRRMEGSAGFGLRNGTTHIMITGSYSDSNQLLNGDRNFARRGYQLAAKNDPAFFYSSATPPPGYTSNIRSTTGVNLVLDDGRPLNFPYTFVPVGYAGRDSDNGAALLANAGRYNFELPQDISGARQSLLNNPTISSLALNLRQQFGARLEGFLDLSTRSNQGRAATASLTNTVMSLPANALNNPFRQAIRIRFPNVGLTFESVSDSELYEAAAGLLLRMDRNWTAQADYSQSRSRFKYTGTLPAIDGNGRAALSNGTLDVVRDLNVYPLDFTPYLTPSPNYFLGPLDTTLKTATLRIAGPVAQLPGGPITLSASLERQEQVAEKGFEDLYDGATRQYFDPNYYPERSQTVDSVYLEVQVPLVSAGNALPFVHKFQLQASMRHDSYRTVSVPLDFFPVPSRDGPLPDLPTSTNRVQSTDFTFGLSYAPVSQLTLRASYGTGFLPPSVEQIFAYNDPYNFFAEFADPKRDNVVQDVLVPAIYGGNPDLKPEFSRSLSAGVIFTPNFLSGLRLSVDYTRIRKTDEIRDVDAQSILDNEDTFFAGRVVRAALTSEDAALGYTGGEIIGMNFTLANIASSELQSYDVQLDYGWDTALGTFSAYLVSTWEPHFRRRVLPNSPEFDSVGYAGSPLAFRGNAGFTLDRGAWTFGWNTQYYDSYLVYSATVANSVAQRLAQRQGSATVPSQIYHDLFFQYRFERTAALAGGFFADMDVMAGVQNVFDAEPPVLATTTPLGGFSRYGDPRLRRYSLSVRKHF